MSQGNVEAVRPICDALNRRDWDAVFRAPREISPVCAMSQLCRLART